MSPWFFGKKCKVPNNSNSFSRPDPHTGVSFSEEEYIYAWEKALGTYSNQPRICILDMPPNRIIGIASYALAAKNYDFCDRLLTLAEDRIVDPIDLHYCYLWWIKSLYPRRTDTALLARCEEYCLKDIALWKTIRSNSFFAGKKTLVPSFQKLEAIYEADGRYAEALSLCETAEKDTYLSDHDLWVKRKHRIQEKMH